MNNMERFLIIYLEIIGIGLTYAYFYLFILGYGYMALFMSGLMMFLSVYVPYNMVINQ